MPEYALQMRQISKSYGVLRANDAINFKVEKGTIHALAGENGAGKSTLMKILFGLIEPDSTSEGIFIDGVRVKFRSPLEAIKIGVGMVQQHFALAGALTALDNIILGAEPSKFGMLVDRRKAKDDLARLEISVPWAETADNLTVGLQQRTEILKILFRQAQILIFDEPTAVLTPQEVEHFFQLLKKLRADGKTIILITHKLQEVLSLCDHVTVLRNGQVTGDFSTQGLTEKHLIKAMIGRDIKPVQKQPCSSEETLVELKNVSAKDKVRDSLRGLSLKISRGEIVGIAGVEGNGQQALVQSLLGMNSYEGVITYEKKELRGSTKRRRQYLNFGLISEDRHSQSLWLEGSVSDNCVIGLTQKFKKWGFLKYREIEKFSKDLLAAYGVKMNSFKQPISHLSGGNQQKVVVAREISARKPLFLIASHPTRGVDVGAIEFIHQQILKLQESGSGILLISSELEELCALSDRIVVLFEGKNVGEFKRNEFDIDRIGRAMTGGTVV